MNKTYECIESRSKAFTKGKLYDYHNGYLTDNNKFKAFYCSLVSRFKEVNPCPIMRAINALKGDLSDSYHFNNEPHLQLFIDDGDYVCTYFIDSDLHKYICTTKEFNDLVAQCEINFGNGGKTMSKEEYEAKQQKPIYTQEMKDNGELPKVGMDFISDIEICPEHDGRVTCEAIIKDRVVYLSPDNDIDDEHYETSHNEYVGTKIAKCSPISPEINLEDGECYQFKYINKLTGYYKKSTGRFYHKDGFISAHNCTNIKKLVEEK